MSSSPPLRILIIRLSSIGDILLTTSFVRSVRNYFPNASIEFLTKSYYTDLLNKNPYLDKLHIFEPSDGFTGLRKLKASIRRNLYHIIFDLHSNFRSIYLTTFQQSQVNRYRKRIIPRYFLVLLKWNLYKQKGIIPIHQLYFRAGKRYDLHDDNKGIDFVVSNDANQYINKYLEKIRVNNALKIAIAPGARHSTKRWFPGRFAELADLLVKEYNAQIFLLGGVEDKTICQLISKKKNYIHDFSGILSLMETGALLKKCRLLISNDTGIMHMASGLKIPVIAIFGPTVEEFGFFPYTTDFQILQVENLSCRPCSHLGGDKCPKGHFKCMENILVSDIVNAVKNKLVIDSV